MVSKGPRMDLRLHGLIDPGPVRANLSAAQLVELALGRDEGILASNGALVVRTGKYTGRAARDKYLVRRASSQDSVSWGSTNQPLDAERFDRLLERVRDHFKGRELFVQDSLASADPAQCLAVRVVTEQAWAALFSQCLLIPAAADMDPARLAQRPHGRRGARRRTQDRRRRTPSCRR